MDTDASAVEIIRGSLASIRVGLSQSHDFMTGRIAHRKRAQKQADHRCGAVNPFGIRRFDKLLK
jgi:hypothetical protein